jgi:hypothetical protein
MISDHNTNLNNRPEAAAILARKKILADVKLKGRTARISKDMSFAFPGWPLAHIQYFAKVHRLEIIATPSGIFEIWSSSLYMER